jgi:hypothetical protein
MIKFHVTIDIINGQRKLCFSYQNAGLEQSAYIEKVANV